MWGVFLGRGGAASRCNFLLFLLLLLSFLQATILAAPPPAHCMLTPRMLDRTDTP